MGVFFSSRIPQIIAGLEPKASAAVRKTVFDIEAGAKSRARVDTGAMRAGIGVEMSGPLSGEVIGHADYTIYNELGTSKMAAQPMLTPAAEEARPGFMAAMALLVK